MSLSEELQSIGDELRQGAAFATDPDLLKPVKALEQAASSVGKSSGDSWLGYQSCVYYAGFNPPPAGAFFSSEWGLIETMTRLGSRGDWRVYTRDDVVAEIERRAGGADISQMEAAASAAAAFFDDAQARIVSLLSGALRRDENDSYLADLLEKAKSQRIFSAGDFLNAKSPKGQLMSRDSDALTGGIQAPPHEAVIAKILACTYPAEACLALGKIAARSSAHLASAAELRLTGKSGTHVFIGHGRSPVWKDVRDFLRDRVHLPFDEFNRVPVAGITNISRLSEMLDSAAIAFLIMTGEDEQPDGKLHARLNVVHEAGLFQGKLGFTRAIVLLEDGCEEFSNIHGLGQIRFPIGNIAAVFEEIRAVLEREGIIES